MISPYVILATCPARRNSRTPVIGIIGGIDAGGEVEGRRRVREGDKGNDRYETGEGMPADCDT